MILVELALYALVAVLGGLAGYAAVSGTLASAAARGIPGDTATVEALGHEAVAWWLGGVLIIALARALATRRPGRHIAAFWMLPSALAATGLGLAVQLGYGNPFRADWPGPGFGMGVCLASVVAAVVVLFPWDPAALFRRGHIAIGASVVLLFAALALFGQAPGGSDQRINLGPVQPIEAVKILAVAFLAEELGRRYGKLRWQRGKLGFLRFPRPRVLLPALATLVFTLAGLFLVKDFGPTLILSAVFLGMFFIATRSPGWVLAALGVVTAMVAVFAVHPEWSGSRSVETRLEMWLDPFLNGLPHGDQLALAQWALAAGGPFGTGLGTAPAGALPAGHTDLVYAHLVEELGVTGGLIYLVLLGAVVLGGLTIGARNRTPERMLLAAGLAILTAAQAWTILGGTLGVLPLTGVVVPFLSFGKSSMAAFLGLVALIARLAEDGLPRAETDDLRELRAGIYAAGPPLIVLGLALIAATAWPAILTRDETTLRPAVTTLADGTPALLTDPRLAQLAARIRRGSVLDRNGQPLAVSPGPGTRIHPIGDALGTVLGPAEGDLLRAPWSIERQLEGTLRGYPNLEDGPAIWLGTVDKKERLLLAVASADHPEPGEEAHARARLERLGGSGEPRRLPLTTPEHRPLLALARLPLGAREPAIQALSDDVPARSITLTLDARLQVRAALAARTAAKKSRVGVAAVVVMDPATGQVLARAQWPDYDPASGGAAAVWRPLRIAGDRKFMGIYGAWADKTGAQGIYQAGSVFKTLTALAALRSGNLTDIRVPTEGDTCPTHSGPEFACNQVSEGRTSFTLPGWKKPIHDFGDGGARGQVDLVEGLTRSSNVYFGQLALLMGPTPFRQLRELGVEFGNPGLLDETDGAFTGFGAAQSRRLAQTGFGQGAGSWNVTQAARLVATLANGGTYFRCPPDMQLSATCTAIPILEPGASTAPILAGMRGVIDRGTGARLPKLDGVRLYGKTGTADAPGTRVEAPYGIRPAAETEPHSWFVAIAEPADAADCGGATAGRYVVAGVVPHGGFGAQAAGPMVIEVVKAMQELDYLPRRAPEPKAAAPTTTKRRR